MLSGVLWPNSDEVNAPRLDVLDADGIEQLTAVVFLLNSYSLVSSDIELFYVHYNWLSYQHILL